MRRTVSVVIGCIALAVCNACGDKNVWSGDLASPDLAVFRADVYPVLLRDCSFAACHGGDHRFFQVYGPRRSRLLSTTKPEERATDDEIQRTYERARSMLVGADTLENAPLLSKPLEVGSGGQGHKGVDDYGRNVYASRSDPGYLVLFSWAHTQASNPQPLSAADGGAP